MRNKKLIRALLVVALAVMSLFVPGAAFASDGDVVTLTQTDFDAAGGEYVISTSDHNYQLGGPVSGSIRITTRNRQQEFSIDLCGYTLAADNGADAICVEGIPRVTIKNGRIEQLSSKAAAVRCSSGLAYLILDGVELSALNHTCFDMANGELILRANCSATLTITDESASGEALFTKQETADIYVWGGTYRVVGNGYGIVKALGNYNVNYTMIVHGGEYSSLPSEAYPGTDVAALARAGSGDTPSGFSVLSSLDAAKAGNCYVETKTNFGNVYFESRDQAVAWSEANGLDPETSVHNTYRVTFDSDGGTPVEEQQVNVGDKVQRPENPTRDKYTFLQWVRLYRGNWYPYNFSLPVDEDLNLKAEWKAVDPIAEVDGKEYASVQDAVDAASGSAAITLLKDTIECVTIGEGKDITLDLNGFTLTSAESEDGGATRAISVTGSARLSVANGSLSASGNCVYVDGAATGSEVSLDLDAATSTADSVVSVGAGKLTILGGTYEAAEGSYGYALSLFNGSNPECEVRGGKFVVPEGQSSSVAVANASPLTVYAGEFAGGIVAYRDRDVTIYGGSFGSADNAESVAEGKCLLKHAEGSYEVLDATEAKKSAACVATDGRAGTKVYFESEDEGAAYAEEHSRANFAKVHVVTFVSRGKTVGETLYLEDGEVYGELPVGEEVPGYTFAGWYVGGDASKPVTAEDAPTFELDHEVKLVAMWVGNGSDEPTDGPDSGSDGGKAMPQTGDVAGAAGLVAAAGAALGALGVARRRK